MVGLGSSSWMLALAPALVIGATAALLILQARDRKRRGEWSHTSENREYFRTQDRRRRFGLILMGILSVGVVVGLGVTPGTKGHPNPVFVGAWLVNGAIAMVLPVVAALDWRANFQFARRNVRDILEERQALFDELRVKLETARASSENRGEGGSDWGVGGDVGGKSRGDAGNFGGKGNRGDGGRPNREG